MLSIASCIGRAFSSFVEVGKFSQAVVTSTKETALHAFYYYDIAKSVHFVVNILTLGSASFHRPL